MISKKQAALRAVRKDGSSIVHCDYAMRNDKDVVREACISNHHAFSYASPRLRQDEKFKASLKADGYLDKLDDDYIDVSSVKKSVLAVRRDVANISILPDEMRHNAEVVKAYFHREGEASSFIMRENPLSQDRDFLNSCINEQIQGVFYAAHRSIQADKDFVISVLSDPDQLNHVKLEFVIRSQKDDHEKDRNYVDAILSKDGYALEFMPNAIKTDKRHVLTAVTNKSSSMQYASPIIQDMVGKDEPVSKLERIIRSEELHAKMKTEVKVKPETQSHQRKI